MNLLELTDEVHRAYNDMNHDHLCSCSDWKTNDCEYYKHGYWDSGITDFVVEWLHGRGLLKLED